MAAPVAWDGEYGLHKVSPLLEWTEKEIWEYIRRKRLPYNTLHDKGFPSIGCAPCTRAVQPGDDQRSGRWWWERSESRECGLHSRPQAGFIK
jgi:phosphoadenosine phosphosulfate reductase